MLCINIILFSFCFHLCFLGLDTVLPRLLGSRAFFASSILAATILIAYKSMMVIHIGLQFL